MISCPAANGIRWVNPSRATVSPSRTNSAIASLSCKMAANMNQFYQRGHNTNAADSRMSLLLPVGNDSELLAGFAAFWQREEEPLAVPRHTAQRPGASKTGGHPEERLRRTCVKRGTR